MTRAPFAFGLPVGEKYCHTLNRIRSVGFCRHAQHRPVSRHTQYAGQAGDELARPRDLSVGAVIAFEISIIENT